MPSRTRLPLLAAGACASAFALMLVLAYAVPAAGRVDSIALSGMATLDGAHIGAVASLFADSADPLPVGVFLAALCVFGMCVGRPRHALAAVAFVVAAAVTTESLKVLLEHQRVYGVLAPHQVGATAFPSGHATGAMGMALAAVLVAPPRFRRGVAAAAAAYAFGVCTSLIILRWHFPSDVFGGMLVAGFYFCLAVAALRWLGAREPGRALPRPSRLAISPRLSRDVALAALGAGALLVAVRAGEVSAFASEHTIATAIAIAVAVGSTVLVTAASLIADR